MISRTTMSKQMKGNKMALPKPRPKAKKKIGDDLVDLFSTGVKRGAKIIKNKTTKLFSPSKKKVPDSKKSPIRKLADAKKAKKDKLIKSQKESTKFIGKKANATVDPRIVRKAKPKKGPIVTKKQLKDSGFTNLRDYLNDKQGKVRRKGPVVPERVAPSAGAGNVKRGDKKRNVVVKKSYGGSMKRMK